jgi:uncharacterized HAD superfamily protein
MKQQLRRLNIGIDIDGCIADWLGKFLWYYNWKYGTDLKPEQVTDIGLISLGQDFVDRYERARLDFSKERYVQTLEPMDGAAQVLQAWYQRGHNEIIITDRPIKTPPTWERTPSPGS